MTATALPERSKALLWRSAAEGLAVVDVATPVLEGPDEIVVRVRAAMFGAALVRAVTVGHPTIRPPRVLGSLVVGDVVAAGESVRGLDPGDRVTLDPHPSCGECTSCVAGAPAVCASTQVITPGAHAQYARVAGGVVAAARRVPATVSDDEALLTEILACVLSAVRAAGDVRGRPVLVIGSGVAGLLLVQAARLAGASLVLCTVKRASRAVLVSRWGGVPVDVRDADWREEVRARTDGLGPYVVVEAVGSAETYRDAVRLVRCGGVVVGFGGCPPSSAIELDLNRLHYDRITLVGAYHYETGLFDEALAAIADRSIELLPLLGRSYSLAEAVTMPERVRRDDCLVAVVRPWP